MLSPSIATKSQTTSKRYLEIIEIILLPCFNNRKILLLICVLEMVRRRIE
jgi:hypothetical protein